MAPITYLGGLHGPLRVVSEDETGTVHEDDVYRGYDAQGQPLHLQVGETVDVDEATAARLADDHPGFFEIDGEVRKPAGEKTIDEMTGKELDELAAELDVDGWDKKATVGDKKEGLKAAVAERLTPPAPEDVVRAQLLTVERDQLNAAATELGVDAPEAIENVEELVDAILAKKAEQTNGGS